MEESTRFVASVVEQVIAHHEGEVAALRGALTELLTADEALDRHSAEQWPVRRRQMAMRRAARLLRRTS